MHLKKLEMHGFKSFADKTEIEFKDGITGIVGPNGSGKSNIADAVRWVLGEQSVKNLRGNKMEDVIFSGTEKRRAVGYAEVTIVFDNKDLKIPIEYSEVAVTRRMFRSGESEYYINKNSCRLKDIRELFMDTGVGKEGYSIIGQGRVDEILSTKPEDRRNIFEEASGIVKFKMRKEESEKKLDKTEENILRINDIITELESQIGPLKEQSETAKEYLKLSQELKEIQVNLFLREIDNLNSNLLNLEKDKKSIEDQIKKSVEENEYLQKEYLNIKSKLEEKEGSIENIRNKNYEIQSSAEKYQNELSLINEKERYLNKEKERIEGEITNLNKEREELLAEEKKEENSLKIADEELIKLSKKLAINVDELDSINNEISLKDSDIQSRKDNIFEKLNSVTDIKNKIINLNAFEENINKRICQIDSEIEEIRKEKSEKMLLLNGIKKSIVDREKEFNRYKEEAENRLRRQKKIKSDIENISLRFNELKENLNGKISNFQLLKNMEEEYEGFYKSVRGILKAIDKDNFLSKGVIGVVANLIKVDKKFEKAIEMALGSNLQNIVVDKEETAKKLIDYLKRNRLGRATFLPCTAIRGNKLKISYHDSNEKGIVGVAVDLIDFDKRYMNIFEYLMGRTLIVENMDWGIAISKKYKNSFKIVTLDGNILNPGGSITGGSVSNAPTNILVRKMKLDELVKDIDVLKEEKKSLENNIWKLKSLNDKEEADLEDLNEKIKTMNIEIIQMKNEEDNIVQDIERLKNGEDKYLKEKESLNAEKTDMKKESLNLKDQLKEAEEGNTILRENMKEEMENFEIRKKTRDELNDKVTQMKIEKSLKESNLNSIKEKINNIKEKIGNSLLVVNTKKEEIEKLKDDLFQLVDKKKALSEKIDACKYDLQNSEEELEKEKEKKKELTCSLNLKDESLNIIKDNISKLEKNLNNINIKEAKYSVQVENCYGKLMEEYELTYEEGLDYKIDIDDEKKYYDRAKDIKECIKNLGTVNLSSVEEYKKVKERLDFIKDQRKDLVAAKEDLINVIKEMEEKMREQFVHSFNLIRKNFNEVFVELFGGGKADIYLEEPEKVLTSGIEIISQPPGKKLQSLTLLSGGEKSLTAVALLFSILKTKPTPFCILDEIDAALDEGNIYRYTKYLKKISQDTQFIIITHRKNTMEIADVLHGATMEEEGVTKMVSIKLKDKYSEIAS